MKVLDSGNVERTISQVKVMDASNVLRTVAFIRVLGSDMVVREVFTTGGTGGATNVSISPSYQDYGGGKPPSRSGIFTVQVPTGAAPTSFSWSLLSGSGSVSSGGATASATLTVHGTAGQQTDAVFNCDVVIGGTTYSAQCTLSFYYELVGGVQQ